MEELISVVVPVYNVEKYLDKCIDSILSQTYMKIEVILVDDGSTDLSAEICDRWAKTDNRIRVIHKPNGGLSDARNTGLNAANGCYICFFDSDDWIEPYILEKAYSKMLSSDVVIWGYKKDFVDLNENIYKSVLTVPEETIIVRSEGSYKKLIDSSMMALIGYAWNKLYRISLIRENNFQFKKGVSLVEDMLFNGPILSVANSVSFISCSGTHYIQRQRETLGSKFYPDYFELKILAVKEREKFLKSYGANDDDIFALISKEYFSGLKSSCRMACLSLSKEESIKYMRKICTSVEGKRIIHNYKAKGKDVYFKLMFLSRQYWIYIKMYR